MDKGQKRSCGCGKSPQGLAGDMRIRAVKQNQLYKKIMAVHERKNKISPVNISKVL